MITKQKLILLLNDTESYRTERTVSTDNTDKFCQAICAFSNDISESGKNGYLILGAHDNGRLSGLKVSYQLLLQISNIRTDCNIFLKKRPIPISVLREEIVSNYPYWATSELLMNAIMHRDYESNAPIQFYDSLITAFKVVENISEKYFEEGFGGDTAPVTAPVKGLIDILEGELTRQEMQAKLDISHKQHFLKLYLKPAVEQAVIEMTIPDKPNSRLQKYRLSSQGKALKTSQFRKVKEVL